MNRKIGFIGAGNIGAAMVKSIVHSGFVDASDVYAADRHIEKLEELRIQSGIHICATNTELVTQADVVIMAVKPQTIKTAIEEIKDSFGDKMLITIAAGVPIKVFEDILGEGRRIFRAMPNLPLLVGEGMTIIAYQTKATMEDREYCKAFFRNFGKVEEMDESLLSAVISITSSSPAYVCMMIESMAASLSKMGVPVHLADRIASQILAGSVKVFSEMRGKIDSDSDNTCRIPDNILDEQLLQEIYGTEFEKDLHLNEDEIKNAIATAIKVGNDKALELERL